MSSNVLHFAYEMLKGVSKFQELLLPPDEGLQNSVLRSLESEWVMATELSAAPKSIVTVNTAASAFARAVLWSESMELLFKSSVSLLETDSYSYNVLGLSRETLSWRRAWSLLAPREGVSSVIESFNSAMSGCEKAMLWQASAELLGEVARRSLEASLVSYHALISACAANAANAWFHVLAMLSKLSALRVKPTVPTFDAAVHACVRGRSFKEAVGLLERSLHLAAASMSKTSTTAYGMI